MKNINKILGIILGLINLFSVISCTDEIPGNDSNMGLSDGEVSLQWVAAPMGVYSVAKENTSNSVSRAYEAKDPQETAINKLHLFVFDSSGKYLEATDNSAFQGYRFLNNNSNFVLSTKIFKDQGLASNAIVYAVANVPEDIFGPVGANGRPEMITELGDLHKFVYKLSDEQFTVNLPEDGLPMLSEQTENLSETAQNKVIAINLHSLMARIDLNFTMQPDQESDDQRYPSLMFESVSIKNFPKGAKFTSQIGDEDFDINTDDSSFGLTDLMTVRVENLTGKSFRKNEPLNNARIYMFEHSRVHKTVAEAFPETGKYPDGIDNAENATKDKELKQRYKPLFANEGSACIILHGKYTNHNGYTYSVDYTIYPGSSHIGDGQGAFTLKSNRLYRNNITVTGITVNNLGDEALLDTRVYIDEEKNPYFIEMLRERKHDCHFNVTPMDIYTDNEGQVTVEILPNENGNIPDWIRMEPMIYSPTNENGRAYAENAGEGKRKYFTVGLMDELRAKEHSTKYTTQKQNTEERIYFYIDENVPDISGMGTDENGNINYEDLPDIVPEREAKLGITYQKGLEKEYREIVIRQAGMRKVSFNKFVKGDYNQGSKDNYFYQYYCFYIEEYEEYLTHYDAKNDYDATLEGYIWGNNDQSTGLVDKDTDNWCKYLTYGWYNTIKLMQATGDEDWMTLNQAPRSAAEYCYNKNKRDEDGFVVNANWYFPTVSELEFALEKYYGTFAVFQDKWYWSSNPGIYVDWEYVFPWWKDIYVEEKLHARATKIKYENGDYTHVENDMAGKDGFQSRTEQFRIRAAYIVTSPKNSSRNIPTLNPRDSNFY